MSTKILIVEDDIITSLYLATALKKKGYYLINSATSGERAIEIANIERPDVIVLDIRLSGKLDGLETANNINSLYKPLLIFTSGYVDKGIQDKVKSMKHAEYIIKPYSTSNILEILKKRENQAANQLYNFASN